MTDARLPRRTRPRGFAPWAPRTETLALLATIRAVLDDYRDHLPLTCRQVFYRLVGASGFDKTEAAYARLCEAVGRARRAGLIPFSAIRDDGASRYEPRAWNDPAAFLRSVADDARTFRLDRQAGQRVRLWLLCEATGMAPMLARAAWPRGVPVLSSGGFDSLTAKHDLARELARARRAEVLHIGDHDPSGVHLFAALAEDVGAMVKALGGPRPAFTRLAVTWAQAEELALPSAPPKASDRRSFAGETVQAEAIPPDVLGRLVASAIAERQNARTLAKTLAAEDAARVALLARLEGLP